MNIRVIDRKFEWKKIYINIRRTLKRWIRVKKKKKVSMQIKEWVKDISWKFKEGLFINRIISFMIYSLIKSFTIILYYIKGNIE